MAIIYLKNVRNSFPAIWAPEAYEEGQEKKFKITALVPKNDPQVKAIEKAIMEVATEAWKNKAKATLESIKGNPNKYCFQDGDGKEYDGYAGMMTLAANNKARPTIWDTDGKTPLTEADGKPYAGCYVNLKVEIWAQDNKYGKGIRAKLLGIQFSKDGDSFSAGASVAGEGDFEDLGDGADAEDLA